MRIIIDANGTVDYLRPVQGMTDIVSAGFENILIDIKNTYVIKEKGSPEDLFSDYSEDKFLLHSISSRLTDALRKSSANLSIIRAPYLPINTEYTDFNETQRLMVIDTIEIAAENKCHSVIAAPLLSGIDKSDLINRNFDYYLSLVLKSKENDVMILIENQIRYYNGHIVRGLFSDECEAAEFIDKLNSAAEKECFGFCMNVVNCNLCGIEMNSFASVLGKRINAVVISDCDGSNEVRLLPFTSVCHGLQTDWLNLIRGLRESEFDGDIIMDIADTASAFSPLLKPQLLSLTKSVADYFKWQFEIELNLKKYDKRVLFGAGNMCRNYMKCYGEKYPPLFTCDNNSKVWGNEFCGLEIKNPEELKDIPYDCAVFICNVFYREIEQQLRDMGISNPIEYFNDEYMPSFYYDRLGGDWKC